MLAAKTSIRAVASDVWAFTSSMWAIKSSMHAVQARCGIFHVGFCSLHACYTSSMWDVTASMDAVTVEDRARRHGTKAKNQNRAPR